MPVCESYQTELKCTTLEEMKTHPKWELKIKDEAFEITNGTVSCVNTSPLWTYVTIKNLSSIWRG